MRRGVLMAALLVASGVAGGCRGGKVDAVGQRPPSPVAEVDSMVVQIAPGPANWDGQPGADGLEVVVVFFKQPGQMPVTVKGTVEFQLYEGILRGQDFEQARPLRIWRFNGPDLDACRARSAFGWGYVMQLGWGPAEPATSSVTLVPSYLPPDGRALLHEPVVVTIAAR